MSVFFASGAPHSGSNKALIGYDDATIAQSAVASSSQQGGAAANAFDGYTFDFWRPASSGSQTLGAQTSGTGPFDYIAIAAHNLSTQLGGPLEVQYDDGSNYVTVATLQPGDVTDDGAIFIHFPTVSAGQWRLSLNAASTDLRIGVFYVGTLLQMQRTIYGGLNVPNLSREENVIPNRSEAGNFLGAIVTRESYRTSLQWENLEPDWYRNNFDPFVKVSRTTPFFLAWRPNEFPDEVVYAWRTGSVKPDNTGPSGLMSVSMDIEAVTP